MGVKMNSGNIQSKPATKKPVLLSDGNPQIAKAEGDKSVQAYIAVTPSWKQDVTRWLDILIVRKVPRVSKAVKWSSPFYGIEGMGWFLNFRMFNKFVRVAFFKGSTLNPFPPGESKDKNVRYLDIHENEKIDENLVADWFRQAAALLGWIPYLREFTDSLLLMT